ncbi:hypothetical protein BX070DRAFT_221399 [Coemansia spiralis]|nr:hypothetical protein BX070DRAFT_221399 [Coemansia spiralis]
MSEEGEAEFDVGQISDEQSASFTRVSESADYRKENISSTKSREASDQNGDTSLAGDANVDTRSVHSSGSRRAEYDSRYATGRNGGGSSDPRSPGWSRNQGSDEYYPYKRERRSRSRSAGRPRPRDYAKRSSEYDQSHRDSTPPRRSGYRGEESDYNRGGSSYRHGSRYEDRDYSRPGYSRRYEREPPRYRHRDSDRRSYSRSKHGGRDNPDEGYTVQREMVKDRAIDDLRLRVRAASDRPTDALPPVSRDRSRPASRTSIAALGEEASRTFAVRSPDHSMVSPGTKELVKNDNGQNPEAPANISVIEAIADIGKAVDMDDIEEGEHIEAEIEASKQEVLSSRYAHNETEVPLRSSSRDGNSYGRSRGSYIGRSRSRGRGARDRSRTPPVRSLSRSRNRIRSRNRSRSRSSGRGFHQSRATHDEYDNRRTDGHRDYPEYEDSAYRKRNDDYSDRRDYRARESYGGRSGYYSRYSGARSPDPRDSAYRPERRHYDSRHERYGSGDARALAEGRQEYSEGVSPSRRRSRSRSPLLARDDERRTRAGGYSSRYHHTSRPESRGGRSYSRSPRDRRGTDGAYNSVDGTRGTRHDESRWASSSRDAYRSPSHQAYLGSEAAVIDGAASSNLPPPPPPPPMSNSNSFHVQQFGDSGRAVSPSSHNHYSYDSPYRGYSSRQYNRRDIRTPRGGGIYDTSNPRTPYGEKYEYNGHSRNSSTGGGHYQGHLNSRGHSPGLAAAGPGASLSSAGGAQQRYGSGNEPIIDQPPLPEYRYGTDLYVSRYLDSGEWIEAREQAREQAKRIQELSVNTRKTAFELAYANWGVQRSESQVQLAAWQLERAEQGLGSADRTLIDVTMDDM